MKIIIIVAILVVLFFLFILFTNRQNTSYLLFNQKSIESLHTDLDYTNPQKVFDFVFSNMDNEVTVYPSENYYYFEFVTAGKKFNGAIGLFADIIDEGKILFGYAERQLENQTQENGYTIYLNKSDDLNIQKVNDFKYKINYKGKTVTFNFNQLNITQPQNLNLYTPETFVAPVFDESGLKFSLIYNREIGKFYWILNEDLDLTNLTEDILVDRRTQFVFYNESKRKILIGVNRNNALANNWYDGPFDQIPYNYVKTGQLDIKSYIDMAYPKMKDRIDKYGKINGTDNRIAIAPYSHYLETKEILEKIKYCDGLKELTSRFIGCIIK